MGTDDLKARIRAEVAALKPYDRTKEHRLYSLHAQMGLKELEEEGEIVLRGPLFLMPFGG